MRRPLVTVLTLLLVAASCGKERKEPPAAPDDPPVESSFPVYGDLHAHTRYSLDAFTNVTAQADLVLDRNPYESCLFAHYCAGLDFFATTDHAEFSTPDLWNKINAEIGACNAFINTPGLPDVFIPFIGFEWTQAPGNVWQHSPTNPDCCNTDVRAPNPSCTDEERLQCSTDPNKWAHHCVIFKGLDSVSDHAVASGDFTGWPSEENLRAHLGDLWDDDSSIRWLAYPMGEFVSLGSHKRCDDLEPGDSSPCVDVALTIDVLLRMLEESNAEYIVAPHGTEWHTTPSDWRTHFDLGNYHFGATFPVGHPKAGQPVSGTRDEYFARAREHTRLVEVYSQHGNSEEHRAWPEVLRYVSASAQENDPFDETRGAEDAECTPGAGAADDCKLTCMNPYLDDPATPWIPCCWRQVEVARARTYCENPDSVLCRRRVMSLRLGEARIFDFEWDDGVEAEDVWLDCNQCPNCFQPAAGYVNHGSVQEGLARGVFFDLDRETACPGAAPRKPDFNYVFGFIGSTDNHQAFPGSVLERLVYSEAHAGGITSFYGGEESGPPEQEKNYYYPGGLAAVNVGAKSRDALWQAMNDRHTFATSGDRIRLWFHYLRDDGTEIPMGSEIDASQLPAGSRPRFRVHAVGGPIIRVVDENGRVTTQDMQCPDGLDAKFPDYQADTLRPLNEPGFDGVLPRPSSFSFTRDVCRGTCYNPPDENARRRIRRFEIVKITRQTDPCKDGPDDIARLVSDPWKVVPCVGDESASGQADYTKWTGRDDCWAELAGDPLDGKDGLYYVRAIQEETWGVNGVPIECERDSNGRCVDVTRPYCKAESVDDPTPADECLSLHNERAWSSPIYFRF